MHTFSLVALVISVAVVPTEAVQLHLSPAWSDDATDLGAAEAWTSQAVGPTLVPGLAASDKYATRVLSSVGNQELFTFYSVAQKAALNVQECNGYFSHLNGWTHSWVTMEIPEGGYPVTIEVSKLFVGPITAAKIMPEGSTSMEITGGKALVTIYKACQVNLDVDLQFASTNTGPEYEGHPMHTFSIFANDVIKDAPELDGADVYVVYPGREVEASFTQSVLYFAPGVHTLSSTLPYVLKAGKSYYIPAGAWVKGFFTNEKDGDANIKLFGHGVVSGANLDRTSCQANTSPRAVHIDGVLGMTMFGLTFVNFPNHHLVLFGGDDATQTNTLKNVKVLGWRANGDGVHVGGYWKVSDLFLRTQDDAIYIAAGHKGVTLDRITTWSDANGASFIFTSCTGGSNTELRDSHVLFARSSWAFWSGGRVFNLRGVCDNEEVADISVDGVVVSDPLPTMPLFDMRMHKGQDLQSLINGYVLMSTNKSQEVSTADNGMGFLSDGEAIWPEVTALMADKLGARKWTPKQLQNAYEHIVYHPNIERAAVGSVVLDAVPPSGRDISLSNIIVTSFSTVKEDAAGAPLEHGIPNVLDASQGSLTRLSFNNVVIAGQSMSTLIKDPAAFKLSEEGFYDLTVNGAAVPAHAA